MKNKKDLTIDDLLAALSTPNEQEVINSKELWKRIGDKDPTLAGEFGVSQSELESVLKDWINDNPYNNIA